jgi:NADH dehydrogenase FAD-containing subunit
MKPRVVILGAGFGGLELATPELVDGKSDVVARLLEPSPNDFADELFSRCRLRPKVGELAPGKDVWQRLAR